MKTKEIIEAAGLQNGFNRKNQQRFFELLVNELLNIYDSFRVKDSDRHFTAAVKILRSKWDGISLKIPTGLSEGTWGFFYAKNLGPLKGELCPTWKKRNDAWLRKRELKKKQNNGTDTDNTDVD